jgi:hypothetical protein
VLDQVNVIGDPKKWFWIRRRKEIRGFNWLFIICNTIFQARSIMNAPNDRVVLVNSLYFVSTFVCVVLNLLAHREGWSICVFICSFILCLRQGVRIVDFEQTKPSFKPDADNEGKLAIFNWMYVLVLQMLGGGILILLQLFAFGNVKYIKFFTILQEIAYIIFFYMALLEEGDDFWEGFAKYLSDYGSIMLFLMVFVIKNQAIGSDVSKQINQIEKKQVEIKNIFENLEGPVIIFEG